MTRTISTLIAVLLGTSAGGAERRSDEWPYYGGDAGSSKYSSLSQIDAANVNTLQVAWTWNNPDDALVGSAPAARAF